MEKSVFTLHYDAFRIKLVALRKSAGLTQRQLAQRVQRPRSFVSRIEQGERRLDVIEFFWVCQACGVDPEKTTAELMREIKAIDKANPGLPEVSGKAREEVSAESDARILSIMAQVRRQHGRAPFCETNPSSHHNPR